MPKRTIEFLRLRVDKTERVGRPPFRAAELLAHRLDHPSRRQIKDILGRAPKYLLPASAFLAAFLYWNMLGFFFLFLAALVRYLSPLFSALLEGVNFYKWNRPDVFIGWNYSAIVNDVTLPAPLAGALLVECMKPAWGAVMVAPLAASSQFAKIQDEMGNRGVFLPCLQVTSGDWKQPVSWVLSQVRVAVFEVAEEGKASLAWEVREATRLLGPDRVLFVRRNGDRFLVTCRGRPLPLPPELCDLTPPLSEAPHEEAIAFILGWCATHLPVRSWDLILTNLWFTFYGLEDMAIRFARLAVVVFAMTGLTLLVWAVIPRCGPSQPPPPPPLPSMETRSGTPIRAPCDNFNEHP
jgi:hypothetical protein